MLPIGPGGYPLAAHSRAEPMPRRESRLRVSLYISSPITLILPNIVGKERAEPSERVVYLPLCREAVITERESLNRVPQF